MGISDFGYPLGENFEIDSVGIFIKLGYHTYQT